jgi:hypothetical protein
MMVEVVGMPVAQKTYVPLLGLHPNIHMNNIKATTKQKKHNKSNKIATKRK